jgi:hypothetical protein
MQGTESKLAATAPLAKTLNLVQHDDSDIAIGERNVAHDRRHWL